MAGERSGRERATGRRLAACHVPPQDAIHVLQAELHEQIEDMSGGKSVDIVATRVWVTKAHSSAEGGDRLL